MELNIEHIHKDILSLKEEQKRVKNKFEEVLVEHSF